LNEIKDKETWFGNPFECTFSLIVVIVSIPLFGIWAYLLLGETNVGRRRAERMQEIIERLPEKLSTLDASRKML